MKRLLTWGLLGLGALTGLVVLAIVALTLWLWNDPLPHQDIGLPIELVGNQVLVTAQLDGKALRAQLDTGAPVSVIDLDYARKLGIPLNASRGKINGRPSWQAPGSRLTLGGQHVYGLYAVEMPEFRSRGAPPLLLGVDGVFDHRVAEFDFNSSRLILHRRSGFTPPAGAVEVSLVRDGLIGSHYGLPVSVNGGKPIVAMLDYGSNGGVILKAQAAQRAGVASIPASRIEGTGLNSMTVHQAGTGSILIAGYAFPKVGLEIAPEDSMLVGDWDANLGVGVLRLFHIWLDLAGKRAWLVRPPHYVIGVDDADDGLIRAVEAGGPADQAGLRKGQRIARINGQSSAAYFIHRDWTSPEPLDVEMADGRRLSITPHDAFRPS